MKYLIIIIFLLTISCSNNKVVNTHGFVSLEKKSNLIKINKSNKNDILKEIGRPSSVSLFNENTWYFIERSKTTQSILKLGKSEIEKNNILEISFNNQGIVKEKKLYQKNDMNDLKVSEEITTKTYDTKTYLNKVLTSIRQKIDTPKNNR